MGHWLGVAVFLIAIVGLVPGLVTGSRTSSYVAFAICFLIFVFPASPKIEFGEAGARNANCRSA